jgi:hypothetical protein
MKCNKKGHIAKNCDNICKYCGNLHTNTVCIVTLNYFYEKILKELQRISKPLNEIELKHLSEKAKIQTEIDMLENKIREKKGNYQTEYHELEIVKQIEYKAIPNYNKIIKTCNVTYTSTVQPLMKQLNDKINQLSYNEDLEKLIDRREEIEKLKQKIRGYGSIKPVITMREPRTYYYTNVINYDAYLIEKKIKEVNSQYIKIKNQLEEVPKLKRTLFGSNQKLIEEITKRNKVRENNMISLEAERKRLTYVLQFDIRRKFAKKYVVQITSKTGLCQIVENKHYTIANCETITMLRSDRVNLAKHLKQEQRQFLIKKRQFQLASMTEEKIEHCKNMILQYRDKIVKLQAATMNEERAWRDNYLLLMSSYQIESHNKKELRLAFNKLQEIMTKRPMENKAGKFMRWETLVDEQRNVIKALKDKVWEEVKKQNELLNHKYGTTAQNLINEGKKLVKQVNNYIEKYDNPEKAKGIKARIDKTKENVEKLCLDIYNRKSQINPQFIRVLMNNPKLRRAIMNKNRMYNSKVSKEIKTIQEINKLKGLKSDKNKSKLAKLIDNTNIKDASLKQNYRESKAPSKYSQSSKQSHQSKSIIKENE